MTNFDTIQTLKQMIPLFYTDSQGNKITWDDINKKSNKRIYTEPRKAFCWFAMQLTTFSGEEIAKIFINFSGKQSYVNYQCSEYGYKLTNCRKTRLYHNRILRHLKTILETDLQEV